MLKGKRRDGVGFRTENTPSSQRFDLNISESEREDASWQIAAAASVAWFGRTDAGSLASQYSAAKQDAQAWLSRLDRNHDRRVIAEEATGDDRARFDAWLATCDRNSDQIVEWEEAEAWLRLQRRIAEACALLTMLDFGRGLFDFTDVNHDGRLSATEMSSLADRLNKNGCLVEGALDARRLPRTILCVAAHGHPQHVLLPRESAGPAWFQAMDRNGDGFVSRAEFFGSRARFESLDHDADGYLSTFELLRE